MQICSFNVNSVRTRLDLLLAYLEKNQPDIVGLQETKVRDEEFPLEPFGDLGYEVEIFGQKSYNGVALLSLQPPQRVQKGFHTDGPEEAKRMILGEYPLKDGRKLTVINGYFPQGEGRNHPTKFPAKKKFYADMLRLLKERDPKDPLILMGDLNIAPEEVDIGIGEANAKRWLRTGKCSFLPEEREWLADLKNWGLMDSFRQLHKEEKALSWFDYRTRGFADGRGLRIDQIWLSIGLKGDLVDAGIDYEMRQAPRPSDHCLIWAKFNL